MGRNFHAVCHECEVQLMMLRGKEAELHQFMNEHSDHEKMTEVYNDYVEEPPEKYEDIFDDIAHLATPTKENLSQEKEN